MCDCNKKECCSTRDKILQCACQLFANRGYKETTIQDICNEAEANIASVNYYFRNKAGLYCNVWEYAAKTTNQFGGELENTLPPREWIERTIEQRIRAIFSDGPAGWLPKLIHHEHQDNSHMSETIKKTVFNPIHTQIAAKLRQLLGDDVDPLRLFATTSFVLGTMPGILHLKQRHLQDRTLSETEVNELIQHAKTYVLGGLDAICNAQKTGAEQ